MPPRAGPVLGAIVVVVFALALAFAAAAPALAFVRLMEGCAAYSDFRPPRVAVSAAFGQLKTGDIVLFTPSAPLPSSTVFTQTFYAHSGLVVREGPLVYISESQPGVHLMPDPGRPGGDYRLRHGVGLSPFLVRLKHYGGAMYLLSLSRPLSPGRGEALKAEADRLYHARHPYPSAAQAVAAGLFGRRGGARHCFAHVAHLLDAAGLSPVDRGAPLASAGFLEVGREISRLAGRPLAGHYTYAEPVQLVYDLDCYPAAPAAAPVISARLIGDAPAPPLPPAGDKPEHAEGKKIRGHL